MGKKNSFSDDEKEKLIEQVLEMRLSGMNNGAIATELKIAWQTIEKYFKIGIDRANVAVDVMALVVETRIVTRRIAQRGIRDYFNGKVPGKDVIPLIEFANQFNGVNSYLASEKPERLPDILTIEVKAVPFEKPPEASSSDISAD